MDKVTITQFTDPMMGLSWECEPALRAVETRFAGRVEFRDVMGVLVRDVTMFMTPAERALPPAEAFERYNDRLAKIYLDEEPIAGMPIVMGGFGLFAPERRTSLPLCMAYEAAKLSAPQLAARFLYRLRYATVVERRLTTKLEELVQVAREAGVPEGKFTANLENGAAQDALQRDLRFKDHLGIWQLPAFLVAQGGNAALIPGVARYDMLERAIREVSGLEPAAPPAIGDRRAVDAFLERHPLVSSVELEAAFDCEGTPEPDEVLPSPAWTVPYRRCDVWFAQAPAT